MRLHELRDACVILCSCPSPLLSSAIDHLYPTRRRPCRSDDFYLARGPENHHSDMAAGFRVLERGMPVLQAFLSHRPVHGERGGRCLP